MTEQQCNQAIAAAQVFYYNLSQRIIHEGLQFGFHGAEEITAWANCNRLLSKTFHEAYEYLCDANDD